MEEVTARLRETRQALRPEGATGPGRGQPCRCPSGVLLRGAHRDAGRRPDRRLELTECDPSSKEVGAKPALRFARWERSSQRVGRHGRSQGSRAARGPRRPRSWGTAAETGGLIVASAGLRRCQRASRRAGSGWGARSVTSLGARMAPSSNEPFGTSAGWKAVTERPWSFPPTAIESPTGSGRLVGSEFGY